MKAPSLRLIALLTCFAVARSHAIDVQPPTSGYGISDVYEALYPGLIYVDNPLTGDVCQPIREDITVGPYTNREKALLGVAPTVSLAMPLTMQIATGGTAVILRFPSVRGKRYQVQRGEVVPLTESNWITVQECGGPVVYKSKMVRTPVGGEIIGTGDEAVVTLAVTLVPGEPQYFSYTCLGDIYSDTDALSDWEESILGTNPLNPDTDGDGLLDDWEYVHTGKFGIWPSTISLRLPRNQTANAAIHLYNDTTSPVNYSVTLAGNTGPSYGFEDSVSGTVAYTWEEISTTGTKLENISDVLDGTQPVDLVGFSFPFYGNTFSRVHVSNNGFVTFGTPSSDYNNRPLPSTSAPANLIAAFWDDLDTRTIGDIYYKEESNRLIIQYENVGRYGGGTSSAYTFQIVLFADGRIQFRYKSMAGVLNSATVGIQNTVGTIGLQIAHDSSYVANQMAVEIRPQSVFLSVAPVAGTVPAKTTFSLNALFRSLQLPFGTYTATITTAHNASDVPGPHTTTATLEVFNAPATVALTAPANGTAVLQGDNITLTATATDPEGMQKVEFYNGTTKISEINWPPYSWTWHNPPVGTHTLTARAIDIFGGSTTSAPVTVTVLADADGDRMPDAWESAQFGNLDQDASGDFDGDGFPNIFEYHHGTDPTDPDDHPQFSTTQTGTYKYYIVDPTIPANTTFEKKTIAAAISAASAFDIIEVRPGNYPETITLNKRLYLFSTEGARNTILDGTGKTTSILNITTESVVSGFSIRNLDRRTITSANGGGILVNVTGAQNRPRIIGSVIAHNAVGNRGGGVYIQSGSPTFVSCTIANNFAPQGAGIYNLPSNNTVPLHNTLLWNPNGDGLDLAGQTSRFINHRALRRDPATGHVHIDGGLVGISQPGLGFGWSLTASSPARNAGDMLLIAPTDMDGEPRPAGVAPDIGADEFHDSDEDGLPDWLEALGINDPTGDHDGDGLTNLAEYQTHGTNLLAADTDGDGLSDGDEVLIYVTDPLATDTDDDGFSDGNEVAAGTNPADPESHPALAKYITRTLQYDFDDYQDNRKGVLLVNALWDGSLDKNIPLTDEIPETTLATRAETEIPLPTELPPQARRATLPLKAEGASNLIPNPPCYHASLTHHRVWLKRGGAQDSAETRNFIIVTERTIDGVEQDIKARAATLTIPAGQTISSESITLQESFTENFSGNSSRYQTFTQTLLPIEIKDIQGPGDEDDRHIQSMEPVPKQEQGESVGAYCQRLNAYYQQQVPDRCIAYIDPHRGANDSPDMPQLVAKIPGGPEGLKVRWRLEVDYLRGNGYRTRHFTAAMGGDYAHLNEQWGSEEDTVRIPNGTTEGQPNFTAVMNANEEWRIFEAWASEIAARGFFGGTAKLYVWFPDAQEEAPSDPIMTFRIGGKNPDEAKAKTYINEVVADVDNRLWFSYAIAKHETHGRVREDNVLRYYNQFYNQHQGGPIGDASVDMGWAGWAKAWPLYNLDRYRQGGVRVQNGPGGYGIYQVTGSAQSATAIIPRRTLWNWQDNVKAGMNIIKAKATWVDARYNPLQQTYPGSGPIPTYPLAPTNNRRRLSGWDAYVCTAYNGLDLRSTSQLVRVRINGFKDPQRSCWQPLAGRWDFRHNSNRYCESVYKLIEETE